MFRAAMGHFIVHFLGYSLGSHWPAAARAREKRSRGLRFSDHVFIAGVGGGQAGESDGVEGGADLRVKAAVDLGNAGGD